MAKKQSKSKKKNIEYSDGKNHIAEEAQEARNLEQIIGRKQKSPFQQENFADFQQSIDSMQLSQLQELAVKAGVFPSGTKLTLKNKLIKAYKQSKQGLGNVVQITKPIVEPGSDKEKELLNIINR